MIHITNIHIGANPGGVGRSTLDCVLPRKPCSSLTSILKIKTKNRLCFKL